MAQPDDNRNIHHMTWIAFVLAAILGLLAIIFVRPHAALGGPSGEISRSV